MIHLLFSKCVVAAKCSWKIFQDCSTDRLLGHQNHSGRKGVSAIKRLCYHVAKALGSDTLTVVFNLKDDDTSNGLADQVFEEFKLYQLEKIPTSFIEAKPEVKKREVLLLEVCIWLAGCRNC